MRVAYVTAELPYPLTSGYLRHFHFIRELSRSHAITLLSLSRRQEPAPETRAALAPLVDGLEVFAARGSRLRRRLSLRMAAEELRGSLGSLIARGRADAVLFSGKDTFPALRAVNGAPLVLDVCDAASLRLRGELPLARWPRRVAVAVRLAEMQRVERRLAARTPHLLFASERDRAALRAPHGIVVPNGVDLNFWARRSGPSAHPVVAFTGALRYRSNHDAALRLATRVFPLVRECVPEARLVIAGRDPRPELRAAVERRANVGLFGSCPDLRPHLERAAVYCAPLRFASGIQNKLLEALAMELPVVTTGVAAAGIRAADELPALVVENGDEQLAAAIVKLLGDPGRRAELAFAGQRYVERNFSWQRSAARVEEALYAAANR